MVVIEGYMRQVWDHVTTLTEICYLMLSSDPVERSQVRQLLAELTVLNRRLREAQNAYQDLVNSYQDLVETLLAVIETL
jgi:predicted transcriptional regulator